MTAQQNWTDSLNGRIDFERRSGERNRRDADFDWSWSAILPRTAVQHTRRAAGKLLRRLGFLHDEWFNQNSASLWAARGMLDDEVSRILFDATIVLRMCGHGRTYFPRIDFDDLLRIGTERPFSHEDLPKDFSGLPLRVFDVSIIARPDAPQLRVLTTRLLLDLTNRYRQYLIRRGAIDISPTSGEVVLDCGACIGDTALLFAGMVGDSGQVHLFDPIPLHARYCSFQAAQNPSVADVMHMNSLAVGRESSTARPSVSDATSISPAARAGDTFPTTTLDEYTHANVARVDFIKMDIEGAELGAIDGAAQTIKEFKPRLAISAYHRLDDFWTIPMRLRELNPGYRLFFGHHTPISWESVYYAVDRTT